jgi:hypothetical protein
MADERGSKRVNFSDASSGRDAVLSALHTEKQGFFALGTNAGDKEWTTASACAGWDTRDVVGHLVDTTQTYLARYEMALND